MGNRLVKSTRPASPNKPRAGIAILLTTLFIAALGLTILEKTHTTDLIKIPNKNSVVNSPDRMPGVNYTPPTKEQQEIINRQKSDLDKQNNTSLPRPTTNQDIGIQFINTMQDNPNGPVYINARLTNVTSGECTLQMEKDGTKVIKSAKIFMTGTYYSCEGFEIPMAELSIGDWKATLTAKSEDGRINDAQTHIKVY